MKIRHGLGLMFATICALVAPASAQIAETPNAENAQKFLETVLVGAPFIDDRVDIWYMGPLAGDNYTADGRRWENFSASQIASAIAKARTYRIVSWLNTGDVCQSKLEIEGKAVVLTGPPIKSTYSDWRTHTSQFGQDGNRSIIIDWSKISSASVSGKAVALVTTQPVGSGYDSLPGANQIKLILPDEGLATRAAFASEVIRLRCDPTKGLGF